MEEKRFVSVRQFNPQALCSKGEDRADVTGLTPIYRELIAE